MTLEKIYILMQIIMYKMYKIAYNMFVIVKVIFFYLAHTHTLLFQNDTVMIHLCCPH